MTSNAVNQILAEVDSLTAELNHLRRETQRGEERIKNVATIIDSNRKENWETENEVVKVEKDTVDWISKERVVISATHSSLQSVHLLKELEAQAVTKLEEERKTSRQQRGEFEMNIRKLKQEVVNTEERSMKVVAYRNLKLTKERVDLKRSQLNAMAGDTHGIGENISRSGRHELNRDGWSQFKQDVIKLAKLGLDLIELERVLSDLIIERNCLKVSYGGEFEKDKETDIGRIEPCDEEIVRMEVETSMDECELQKLDMEVENTAVIEKEFNEITLDTVVRTQRDWEEQQIDGSNKINCMDSPHYIPPTPRTKQTYLKLGTNLLSLASYKSKSSNNQNLAHAIPEQKEQKRNEFTLPLALIERNRTETDTNLTLQTKAETKSETTTSLTLQIRMDSCTGSTLPIMSTTSVSTTSGNISETSVRGPVIAKLPKLKSFPLGQVKKTGDITYGDEPITLKQKKINSMGSTIGPVQLPFPGQNESVSKEANPKWKFPSNGHGETSPGNESNAKTAKQVVKLPSLASLSQFSVSPSIVTTCVTTNTTGKLKSITFGQSEFPNDTINVGQQAELWNHSSSKVVEVVGDTNEDVEVTGHINEDLEFTGHNNEDVELTGHNTYNELGITNHTNEDLKVTDHTTEDGEITGLTTENGDIAGHSTRQFKISSSVPPKIITTHSSVSMGDVNTSSALLDALQARDSVSSIITKTQSSDSLGKGNVQTPVSQISVTPSKIPSHVTNTPIMLKSLTLGPSKVHKESRTFGQDLESQDHDWSEHKEVVKHTTGHAQISSSSFPVAMNVQSSVVSLGDLDASSVSLNTKQAQNSVSSITSAQSSVCVDVLQTPISVSSTEAESGSSVSQAHARKIVLSPGTALDDQKRKKTMLELLQSPTLQSGNTGMETETSGKDMRRPPTSIVSPSTALSDEKREKALKALLESPTSPVSVFNTPFGNDEDDKDDTIGLFGDRSAKDNPFASFGDFDFGNNQSMNDTSKSQTGFDWFGEDKEDGGGAGFSFNFGQEKDEDKEEKGWNFF